MDEEPMVGYKINFYDTGEIVIVYTTYEKAEKIADDFGEDYEFSFL